MSTATKERVKEIVNEIAKCSEFITIANLCLEHPTKFGITCEFDINNQKGVIKISESRIDDLTHELLSMLSNK